MKTSENISVTPKVRRLQLISLISLSSIFSTLALYRYFVDPLNSVTASSAVLILQVAPLLMLVFGLLRLGTRQIFFLAMVSLLYFVHGIVLLVTLESRAFGIAEVIFALILCVSTSYLTRNLGISINRKDEG